MIGETDLKQVLLTGRGEGRAAGQALQRWLPPARGKQGYPLLPVGSVSFVSQSGLDAVSFLSHSHIQHRSFSLPPPPSPFSLQIRPGCPGMLLQVTV